MSSDGEVADLRPVVVDLMLPLALIDAFQIRKPPAAGEMWRHIAGEPCRAAGEGDDAVHAELAGELDGVAQCGVMRAGYALVRMEWIAPAVEGGDLETPSLDLTLPCPLSQGLFEQPRHIAMSRGRVGTGADLEPADLRRLRDHPVHDFAERLACQRLRHQTYLQLEGDHAVTRFGAFQKRKPISAPQSCQAS